MTGEGFADRSAIVERPRLVAATNVHGGRRILTFNTADFARYAIEALHPTALPA